MSHPLRWSTLIALQRPTIPSFDSIAAWLRASFPDVPQLAAAGTTDKLLTLTIGDLIAAITLVPRPIPQSQLEGPAATAWYWPDAAAQLRGHQLHLLVTIIDEGGRSIEKAIALTQLTAAAAALSPSVGIFWGPGRLVHAPQAFLDQVLQMSKQNLPLFLWIDFRIEPNESGGSRLFTTGLEALGQSELEVADFRGPPQELLDFAYNIAHYLLDKRKVIDEGDTIGVTDEVQATAHRRPSMLDGGIEVISLEFDKGSG